MLALSEPFSSSNILFLRSTSSAFQYSYTLKAPGRYPGRCDVELVGLAPADAQRDDCSEGEGGY